jgi:hypothetical protein
MSLTLRLVAISAALSIATACVSDQQVLAEQQGTAVETALARGRFDLNCPTATSILLSSDLIQPAIQGPWVSGVERLEYTVGVQGCGEHTTVVVMCQRGGSGCFATSGDRRFQR